MSHAVLRSLVRFGAVSWVMAAPAGAQIKPIAVQGPTQLTAKPVAGGVQLDWLAPSPTYPGVSYNILRSDTGSPLLAVVTPKPVTQTTYIDALGTLVLAQPKTLAYAVQAIWPNGVLATSSTVTITLPATQRLGTLTGQCLALFDLPAPQLTIFPKFTQTNANTISTYPVGLYLTSSYEAAPYASPMTLTIANSSNVGLVPNGSTQLQYNSGFYGTGWPVGSWPENLNLSFDITLSAQDAQCNGHRWMGHWSHSGPI